MGRITRVYLFGSLRKRLANHCGSRLELDLVDPTSLSEVLRRLEIPMHMVQIAVVNFRSVSKDSVVHPGDRLSLFPREYVVFGDWKNLRF
jgi:hypothetical protein